MLYHLMLSGNFYGLEIWHGIFLGLNFGPGIFLGFVEALGIFWGFDFCPHSIIPVTWNPEYPAFVQSVSFLFWQIVVFSFHIETGLLDLPKKKQETKHNNHNYCVKFNRILSKEMQKKNHSQFWFLCSCWCCEILENPDFFL